MAADPAKALLNYSVVRGGLFKQGARIEEQLLINLHGLGKNGGTLLNKINSVAKKYWQELGI